MNEKEANFVDNLKLKTYLLAERVIDQRAKGKVTPWPFWPQLVRSATLTGLAMGSLALIINSVAPPRDALSNITSSDTNVCAQPLLYSDLGNRLGLVNPNEVLNMKNRYGGGVNIGFYTELDMDIEVNPDDLRLALGQSLGVDKIWNAGAIQPLFLFLHTTFRSEGSRESYLDNDIGLSIEGYTLLYLHQNNFIQEAGRTAKVQIPVYDVINRALVNHARRIETHKSLGLRSAVTQELVIEMRTGLGEELIKSGVIPAIPPLTNTDLLRLQESTRVDYIPVSIISDVCIYTNVPHSA